MHDTWHDESVYDELPYGDGSVDGGTPTPGRRRGIAVVLVASLAALAVGAVAVDRVAAARAESRTAEAFQDGMHTPLPPAVHVRGFPVLTQLAQGTLRHVDLTAHDIPADGTARPLPVTRLTLAMDDLRTSGDAGVARAGSVEATAFLSYADVSDALGLELVQDAEPGRVGARISLPFAGEVTVSTSVSALSGNRIAFRDFRVDEGELPAAGRALLDKVLAAPIQLRNIPEGLRLRSVTTTATGLEARFTGRTVTFRPDTPAESAGGTGSAVGASF